MKDVYLVTYRPGPAWIPGKYSPEQPGYRRHADYLNLVERTNRLVIGGPLADLSHVHLAIEGNSEEAVRLALDADPWLFEDMLQLRCEPMKSS
jgi:uncharacterized protein YciI